MILRGKHFLLRFLRQTQGGAVVEFAVISTVLVLIIAGILDFGHAWYMRHAITNASREGARYGITYKTDNNGNRIPPSALSPTIQNYVQTNYLNKVGLPSDANPSISVAGTGYTSGAKGFPVEVTVTAIKTWFIVSGYIPGLGSQKTLTATTVMLCE